MMNAIHRFLERLPIRTFDRYIMRQFMISWGSAPSLYLVFSA